MLMFGCLFFFLRAAESCEDPNYNSKVHPAGD